MSKELAQQQQSKSVAERRQEVSDKAQRLDAIVMDRIREIGQASTQFTKALAVGRAYLDIKRELVDQMDFVMALMGQANGFKCDKEYPPEVVKKCCVDAIVFGLDLVGNHFNIIGGNMYCAQNGWKHKLRQIKGFSFVNVPEFELPKVENGTSVVKCKQEYAINGEAFVFEFTAYVRINGGSTIDNTLGKAKAKLWHALWEKITGETWSESGDIDEATAVAQSRPIASLKGQPAKPVAIVQHTTTNAPPVVQAPIEQDPFTGTDEPADPVDGGIGGELFDKQTQQGLGGLK